jgi:methylthioribulose 1-phosphate dehydratase/enolase-phosphatase E1
MAPSGVQKELMKPADIFVLDGADSSALHTPLNSEGKPAKLSECAPLFQSVYDLRGAGAVLHSHALEAVMVTLDCGDEFRITGLEMIKGIKGNAYDDTLVIPVIENTPRECQLTSSLRDAIERYPNTYAVLVRRHGIYVWGEDWKAAKRHAECYHYLFSAYLKMKAAGFDPTAPLSGSAAAAVEAATGNTEAATGNTASAKTTTGGVKRGRVAAHPQGCSKRAAGPSGNALAEPTVVLLDIEGTLAPITFVSETLFPYARQHVGAYLESGWGSKEVNMHARALAELAAEDAAAGTAGAVPVPLSQLEAAIGGDAAAKAASIAALEALVHWLMNSDRKVGPLKALQGHVWRAGYESGALKGDVYADAVEALSQWHAAGKRVYIYSSGSREAQRLLFKYSSAGDLRPYLSGYFDTTSGSKRESESYRNIALSLGVDNPSEVLFATDILEEAAAAAEAGSKPVLLLREGNKPIPEGHGYPTAHTLTELL